jgi:flagellar basal body-associated protein FliL
MTNSNGNKKSFMIMIIMIIMIIIIIIIMIIMIIMIMITSYSLDMIPYYNKSIV